MAEPKIGRESAIGAGGRRCFGHPGTGTGTPGGGGAPHGDSGRPADRRNHHIRQHFTGGGIDWRGAVLPWLRISGTSGSRGPLGYGASDRDYFRIAARFESWRDVVQRGEYGGFWSPFRVRVPAQPRFVAPHGTTFRMELHPPPFRGERQRA